MASRRTVKSSTLPVEESGGKTPARQPRRRKQPTTSKTPAKQQQFIDNDDYSFAATSANNNTNSGSISEGKKMNGSRPKSNSSSSSSSRSGSKKTSTTKSNEKENSSNGKKDGTSKTTKSTSSNNNSTTNTAADTKKKGSTTMDDLNNSMAQISLATNNNNIDSGAPSTKITSEYIPIPFPPPSTNTTITATNDSDNNKLLTEAIKTLSQQSPSSKESTLINKLFTNNKSLVDIISTTSYNLSSQQERGMKGEGILVLDDNINKLIDVVKCCLKLLTSTASSSKDKSSKDKLSKDKSKKKDSKLDIALLRLAIHTLRSVISTLQSDSGSSTLQVVIKLFYHCIVISGDVCHDLYQSLSAAEGNEGKKKLIVEYALLCLAAYEGLSNCLQLVLLDGGKKKNKVSKKKSSDKSGVVWDELIPISTLTSNEGTKPSSKNTPPQQQQYDKIIMESGLCISSSLLYLSLVSMHGGGGGGTKKQKEELTITNEFHFVNNTLHETTSGKHNESHPTFVKVMKSVVLPCILHSLNSTEVGSSSEKQGGSSFNVDALRHVKKAFRLLWDGARHVEDVISTCSIKNESKELLRMSCLELQNEGIQFITQVLNMVYTKYPSLLTTKKSISSGGVKELFALFDRAASSAMKSVGMYEKSTSIFISSNSNSKSSGNVERKKSALLHFHRVVGDELDSVALHLSSSSTLPASYYEYCVYRSIHQWRLSSSIDTRQRVPILDSSKQAKGSSSESIESAVSSMTYSIVQLVLEARYRLQSQNHKELPNEEEDCERIISTFESAVINNNNCSPTSLNRCRSMLMMLNLQREATGLITSTQQQKRRISEASSISILASILGRCLAPLEYKLSRLTKDQSRSLNFRLSYADCCAKSASLYDIAAAMQSDISGDKEEGYTAKADLQLSKAYEILVKELGRLDKDSVDRKAPSIVAIEMFAKAATFVGKRRFDRKENQASIQPLILASEIMTKVAIKAEGKELFTSYQTSSRFMYLSSALEANNNNVQSCAALAMAAWCAIESLAISSDEERPEGDSTAEEILLFPDSTVLSVRSETDSATDVLSPIIKRLVRAYIECKSPYNKESSQVDDDSHLSTISNTLMGKILSVATSSASDESGVTDIRLSKVLHCAVWNQTRYEDELSASQIADVIREVLRSTMKIMKSTLPNDEDDKLYFHLIDELKLFIHAQTKRLGDVIDTDLLQVISSSLHITFTSHFIDLRLLYFTRHSSWVLCKSLVTKKKREYKLLKESCLQVQQAEEKFADSSEVDGQSVPDLCFFTQWTAVQLHHAILKEHLYLAKLSEASESNRVQYRLKQTTNYIQTLGTCRLAVDQLCEAEEEEVYSAVIESLISTLKRLFGWFTYHSDTVSATECFVLLQKVYSFVEQTEHPLDVASSFLLVSAKFDDMMKLFNEHMDGAEVSSDDPQVNSMLQCLNLLSQTVDPDRSSELIVDFKASLHQVSRCIESEVEKVESETNDEEESICPNDMIQKRLFITMMLMLYSKFSLDAGQPTEAIKYLDLCRNQCRELVRYMRSVKSYSNSLSMDDIAIQVDDMLATCYERSAVAFCLLGIRRKAEDCALLAVLKQKVVTTEKFALINQQDLIKLIGQYPGNEPVLCPIRSLLKVKALSLSEDKMGDTLVGSTGCEVLDGDEFIHMLSKSKNILAYDDSFSCLPSYAAKSHTYITQVYKQLKKCTSQEDANTNVPLSYFIRRVGAELKLRRYRNSSDNSISTIMTEITASKYGSGICNAEAYYHLGLIELRKARDNGELQTLWNDHAIDSGEASLGLGDSNLLEARKLFHYAISEAPPASHNLTKNILRCLALVTGPKDGQPTPGLTAASLIHISVGGTSRNIVSDAFKGGKVQDSFQAFDDESLDHEARVQSVGQLLLDSASSLPSSWNIATIATCPTGDLLVSSLRVSTSSSGEKMVHIGTSCIFPGSCENNNDEIGIQGDVLTPLDQIIERSQKQLHGITEEVQEQLNEESSKRKWWKKRHSIDEDLQSLLRYAEKAYFGHDLIRQRLIPDKLFGRSETINNSYGNDDDDSSECSDLGPSKLFETTDCDSSVAIECPSFDKESERSELTKLTVAVIKSKLVTFDIAEKDVKKMRKTELIELLLSKMEDSFNSISELEKASSKRIESSNDVEESQLSEEPCTILVLDEHLLRFPFESMDMMSNKAVTRVPCLSFVLATLLETEVLHSSTIPMADPRKVKYVLDPESNLAESASTLGSALNLIASSNGWTWEGVVGEMPPSEFMQEALTEENGLYLYCGHGGGEKAYSRSQVEDLMTEREDGIRGCRAPVILMGCSSGKLKSVNTPNDPTTRQHDKKMHYEPEGIALNYLYAGAPCVVGNLWDVTDRDIDRYCLTLVEDFLLPSQNGSDTVPSHSLAKCVAKARRACKLRYIVGSAPGKFAFVLFYHVL